MHLMDSKRGKDESGTSQGQKDFRNGVPLNKREGKFVLGGVCLKLGLELFKSVPKTRWRMYVRTI